MDLQSLPISSLPVTLKLEDAFEIAHGPALNAIEASLDRRVNVLVTCPRETASVVLQCLRARFKRAMRKDAAKLVAVNGQTTGDSSRSDSVVRMLEQLRESLRAGVSDRVLVLTDLDAMVGRGDNFDRDARSAIPMLFEDPGAVFLAFHDPLHVLSRAAAPLFRTRVTIEGIACEPLSRLVTQREARAMHATEFDAFGLHRFVASLNAVSFRRAMEELGRQHEAIAGSSRRAECYRALRALTCDGLSVPTERFERDVAGYPSVVQTLRDEVVSVHQRRFAPGPMDDVAALTESAVRTVSLHGPRGCGKRLLARCIASALNAVVVEFDETELDATCVQSNVREVVRRARQVAPSVIVLGVHTYSANVMPEWVAALNALAPEESVLLVALSLGNAPIGDFDLSLQVNLPTPEDRAAIVAHRARALGLDDVDASAVQGESVAQIVASMRSIKRRKLLDAL